MAVPSFIKLSPETSLRVSGWGSRMYCFTITVAKGHSPDAWVSGLLGNLVRQGVETAPFRLGTDTEVPNIEGGGVTSAFRSLESEGDDVTNCSRFLAHASEYRAYF